MCKSYLEFARNFLSCLNTVPVSPRHLDSPYTSPTFTWCLGSKLGEESMLQILKEIDQIPFKTFRENENARISLPGKIA